MRLTLEVTSEPNCGRRIWLDRGQSADVGRTERSFFVFPHDRYMSSLHFQIQAVDDGWVVKDLESTHGTTLNGTAVQQESLRDGDCVVAGSSVFRVHVESSLNGSECGEVLVDDCQTGETFDDTVEIALLNGSWAVRSVPPGWCPMDDLGIRTTDTSPFPFTLMVKELSLPEGVELRNYAQLISDHLDKSSPDNSVDAPRPLSIEGADEAYEIVMSEPEATSGLYQRQVLARKGNLVGVAMLTATTDAVLDGTVQLDQLDQSLLFGHEPV